VWGWQVFERAFVVVNCLTASEAKVFDCGYGRFVNVTDVCDYFDDCFDRNDERNCQYPPGKLAMHSA